MKKFASIFIIAIVLMVSNVVSADKLFPDHLNGDLNFVICDGHMDCGYYIIKDSIAVISEDYPEYIISVDIAAVPNASYQCGANIDIYKTETETFLYNVEELNMFYVNKDGEWEYLDPWGAWYKTGITMPAGELSYYYVYGEKFYGNYESTYKPTGGYLEISYKKYNDEFYRPLYE